jgi:NAD(P)-dependent dehydrogenase (short-subunit alcohol dehydrogenase family)
MRKSTWRLKGKSVLITGAANGIGAATARILVARKTHLSLVGVQGLALLVRGMERRSRTIATPATRLALLVPDICQLVVENMARRHNWATAIRDQERTP